MVKKNMNRVKYYIGDVKMKKRIIVYIASLFTILLLFGLSIIIVPKWGWISFFEIIMILLILLSFQLLISKKLRIKRLEVDDEVRRSLEMHIIITHFTAIILYFVVLLLLLTW